jgi:hypothetical protein
MNEYSVCGALVVRYAREKPKFRERERNITRHHFASHKSHMDSNGNEPGPLQ